MDIEQRYQETLDFLYSFVDYSLTRSFQFTPEKFDLGRMRRLLERLGNPEKQYPVIHIAGTKGKGSVSAFCASVLHAAGYRVGMYTSPHLEDYAERIQVDGEPIPHADMVALVDELRTKIAGIDALTTFELTTALGFLWFARRGVQAAVVEVGLGGRLDATNVVDPVVSVITALSYDHTNVLGNTLAQIAGEKAGIIKPGRPVVSAPQKPEALEVIQKTAGEHNSSLTLVGQDILFGPLSHSLDGQSLFVWTANQQAEVNEFIESGGQCGWHPVELTIPLLGYHQVENAATAYAALTAARRHGLSISDEAILQGFAGVQWPGRFEVLRREPPIIVDSAHNGDSALKLHIALDDYFPGKPVVLIFGVSEDKDVRAILSALLPRVRQVVATQSIHPRAMGAEKIVAMVHQFGLPAKAVLPLEDALDVALGDASDGAAVVATGSLFIAAAIRSVWNAAHAETESSQTHG
jgi:dihydrofolate synthase / folylpolyglutamate synthase